MVAELSLSLVTNTRKGRGSLRVMIAGSGNRPSTLMFGGASDVLGPGIDSWRKKPVFGGTSIFGANWCSLLA